MSFGGFGFHGDVFVENVYSSGVLLIIITQLADNFDVIQPWPAACGGSPGPAAVSRVSKRGNEHEENTARPWWSQSGRIMTLDRDARLD